MKKSNLEPNSPSVEEKLSLLYGDGNWNIRGISRLGIPSLRMKDGPLGLRNIDDDNVETKEAVCYPAPCLTACSFDKDLLYRIGAMIGKECRHNNVNMLLAPGINIKRNPLCGRNFEYFSEDPLLSGKMGSFFVKGIQSEGVGACVKHFACNSQEYYRMVNDSIVDDRALFEIYLKPFEIAVKESSPWSIMCSYNKINGEYACDSYLLKDVLKGNWGYKGVVISDWGATSDYILSHNKGLDVEMPCLLDRSKDLNKAYKKGVLKKEAVEDSSSRILSLLKKAKDNKKKKDDFAIDEARNLALEAALKSIVLLKNDGVLPLKSFSSCCIIGELARSMRYQGGGSSMVLSAKPVSFLDAISNSSKKKIPFAPGYALNKKSDSDLTLEAIDLAAKNKNVILFLGLSKQDESEGFDRSDLQLPENQLRLFDSIYSVNQNIIVVLSCGSPVELPFKGKAKGIVLSYLPGEEGGEYLIQVCSSCLDVKSEVKVNVKSKEAFASKLTSMPIYYLPRKDGFLQYDNDFENLLGHTIPWVKDPKSRPYTLNSTLGDIEKTFIGKKMIKIGLKTLTSGTSDPNYAYMENQIKQTPIRNIVMQKGVKQKTTYLVLYFANGHYLKGIFGYLFGFKKNA